MYDWNTAPPSTSNKHVKIGRKGEGEHLGPYLNRNIMGSALSMSIRPQNENI